MERWMGIQKAAYSGPFDFVEIHFNFMFIAISLYLVYWYMKKLKPLNCMLLETDDSILLGGEHVLTFLRLHHASGS
jgi:hypothetical protein